MIRDADGALKDRLGRVAYVWTGARHLREEQFRAVIKVDDKRWFEGMASCVLVGNIGRIFGGIQVFEGAKADDGRLEIGVVTAKGPVQWSRALARDRGRKGGQVAVRRDHVGAQDQDQVRPCRSLRDRRRRPRHDPTHAHRRRAGRDRRLCARRVAGGRAMSTAGRVPETWELDGDDARETLKRIGVRKLLRDAFMRLRFADGFSHARSMAFATSLVLVQGLIAIVGFAAIVSSDSMVRSVVRAIRSAVPGPASRVSSPTRSRRRTSTARRRDGSRSCSAPSAR